MAERTITIPLAITVEDGTWTHIAAVATHQTSSSPSCGPDIPRDPARRLCANCGHIRDKHECDCGADVSVRILGGAIVRGLCTCPHFADPPTAIPDVADCVVEPKQATAARAAFTLHVPYADYVRLCATEREAEEAGDRLGGPYWVTDATGNEVIRVTETPMRPRYKRTKRVTRALGDRTEITELSAEVSR